MTTQTLMLSQGYEPIKVVSWQRAITLLTLGKVEVIEEYDHEVRSTSVILKMPAVVRLLNAFRRRKGPIKFSRINIYGRDHFRCQYCSAKITMASGTFDHVIPRTQGGQTTWKNIVTCCGACNSKKGGRTPQQSGMQLRATPFQPTVVPIMAFTVSKASAPDAWRDYLYWTSEIDP
jgi:5-methylcytosine-specific restriction endonuclease McrA